MDIFGDKSYCRPMEPELRQITREEKIERRRLIARKVFEALCAQYPEKHIALVLHQRIVSGDDRATGTSLPAALGD